MFEMVYCCSTQGGGISVLEGVGVGGFIPPLLILSLSCLQYTVGTYINSSWGKSILNFHKAFM